jgi:hypothetical protein
VPQLFFRLQKPITSEGILQAHKIVIVFSTPVEVVRLIKMCLYEAFKGKGKQSHNTPMEAQGERRYSSYSFTTSALDGDVAPLPRFTPAKGPPVPIG